MGSIASCQVLLREKMNRDSVQLATECSLMQRRSPVVVLRCEIFFCEKTTWDLIQIAVCGCRMQKCLPAVGLQCQILLLKKTAWDLIEVAEHGCEMQRREPSIIPPRQVLMRQPLLGQLVQLACSGCLKNLLDYRLTRFHSPKDSGDLLAGLERSTQPFHPNLFIPASVQGSLGLSFGSQADWTGELGTLWLAVRRRLASST